MIMILLRTTGEFSGEKLFYQDVNLLISEVLAIAGENISNAIEMLKRCETKTTYQNLVVATAIGELKTHIKMKEQKRGTNTCNQEWIDEMTDVFEAFFGDVFHR